MAIEYRIRIPHVDMINSSRCFEVYSSDYSPNEISVRDNRLNLAAKDLSDNLLEFYRERMPEIDFKIVVQKRVSWTNFLGRYNKFLLSYIEFEKEEDFVLFGLTCL